MTDPTGQTRERVRQALQTQPPAVGQDFDAAWNALAHELKAEELVAWAEAGLALAEQTARSWEAATQYFKASPKVAGLMPFGYFRKWSDWGAVLCKESPALAACYFRASPGAMGALRSRHIETWASLGRGLYKGTWKSSTLSCKFFEASPELLKSLTVGELGQFVSILDTVSNRSYDVAVECLALGRKIFRLLGHDKETFMSLCSSLAETRWREVKGLLDAVGKALPRIEAGERQRFLDLARLLHEAGYPNLPGAMLEMSASLGRLDGEHHARLIGLAEGVVAVSSTAMPEFLRSCPTVLDRVTFGQLERWHEEGVRVLDQNPDGGLAYFRLESARSQEVLDALSSTVEFTWIKGLMELYCRALAGADVELAPSGELTERNIGWVSDESPTTEGSTVFVPSQEDRYPTKQENFALFKVVATHQVAHLEFGSFGFEFERPSTLFEDMRPRLVDGPEPPAGRQNGSADRGWATDMQRFFNLFDERQLALDLFTVVEDGRLDALVTAEYPGIRADYRRVQASALEARRPVQSLPIREALVELLVRTSLHQLDDLAVPSRFVQEARSVVRLARMVQKPGTTVEDAAEATLRVYAILSEVPNELAPPEDWESMDVDDGLDSEDSIADEDLLKVLSRASGQPDPADEQEYDPSQDVDYRGEFKPELVQMLNQLRAQSEQGSGEAGSEAITQDMLEEMLEGSAELDTDGEAGTDREAVGAFAENLIKEAGLSVPDTPNQGQGPLVHVEEDGGALDPAGPQTFVYDEWDFRADDYKPSWCIVRQKPMAEGDPAYFGSTLSSYGPLAEEIKRQFEMLVPEMFRKVRKLEDGVEIDIDDVIEAMIDIRTGVGPSEKLYWKRNKVERDVAVVFLLDTSASTAEAIEDSKKLAEDWDAPKDPVEYMAWLRNRRGEGMRRSYKRIIDLEKEAVVLLIHALEAIGDVYGIYGFSGYGRENVEFYTIKDIEEAFSDRVQRRVDRIAPLHATRMGPAIRHATSKLQGQDARTKLLFLISDGRPQDRGYSREGVEKEYAVHDTRMALDEAAEKDINAFCLTVDKNGHDYLKTMCQDMGYEVLDDIYALPRRLLYLYRRLTV